MTEFQGLTYVVKAKNSYLLVSRSRVFIAIYYSFWKVRVDGIDGNASTSVSC